MASHCPPHEPLPASARATSSASLISSMPTPSSSRSLLMSERSSPPPSTPPRCARQVCQVFVRMPVDGVATAREAENEGVMDVAPAHEAED